MSYFDSTRLVIGCWNDEVRVICVFIHMVAGGDGVQIGGCDYVGGWSNS